MHSGNQSAVDYFLQADGPSVAAVTRDRVVEALDMHDLIAKQQSSRTFGISAPVAPSPIDWRPFIAAFHLLVPKTWRARTVVLNGNLLLRLAGNGMTLEARLCHDDGNIAISVGNMTIGYFSGEQKTPLLVTFN